MTTYVQARDALVTYIDATWRAAYPGVEIFYENTRQVDLDTVGDKFVTVAIDFTDTLRMDMDAAPTSRSFGEVSFRLFAKEGVGTRTTLQMFDFLQAAMKYRAVSGVTLQCPTPGPKRSASGWMSFDLDVPFFFYQ